MSTFVFRLPDIGEGVTEAEITTWYVKPGDPVAEDQSMVDVMTDKATVDMTSPVAGTVLAVHGAVGDMVPVGAPLVEIRTDQDAASGPEPVAAPTPPPDPVAPPPPSRPEATTAVPPRPRPAGGGGAEISAAPLAAPVTRPPGVGVGLPRQLGARPRPGGLITPDDLDRHLASVPATAAAIAPLRRSGVSQIKITGLRRKIAERMQASKRQIPHFTYIEECDLTALESLRKQLNAERGATAPKLTLLPFFMRALVQLQPGFPSVNAHYDDEAGILQVHEGIHVGIATQTSGGLMVPVVRRVEALGLWDCARELGRVTAAARDGSATREDLTGSTITLTSLGALGGIAATPIINAPEVAILGPNRLVDRPVVIDGQVVVRTMMNLSSSFDHRIIDGHEAARFVQALKRLLEQPALLFLEAS